MVPPPDTPASLKAMTRLGPPPAALAARAGHEPTTEPEEFKGRVGYLPDFLPHWTVPMPQPGGPRKSDIRPPRRGGGGEGGNELRYEHFSVIMSASRRLPFVTAVNIDGEELRRIPRISTWSFDGRLDPEDQWGDALYDNNDLDRGHMVRREDPVWGTAATAKRANADTFHFTNACPQMAPVNQHTWLGLEDYILGNARTEQFKVSVFTGPILQDDDLPYRGAQVPRAFWKVVALVTESGRRSATAYKLSQAKELYQLEFRYAGYKTYQLSVAALAKEAGMDFGELPDHDGFSQHELATRASLSEVIDDLSQIRI